jgi:membrane protein DedA with SNARE-associated domain
MTIGASIFVIVVGAILYFAANVHVAHVSINAIGLILMIAGLAGLILGLIQQAIWARRSRREVAFGDRRPPRQPPY